MDNTKISVFYGVGERSRDSLVAFDTLVAYFDMPVACGRPNMTGDVPPVMMMLPSELVGCYDVYCTRAEGDSMEDLGIRAGDLLVMECVPEYRSGDVVVAEIDGEKTLKTYYVDEEGGRWLVPSNRRYRAIRLTQEMSVRFCGRLKEHIRRAPQESTRNIRQAVREARQTEGECEEPTVKMLVCDVAETKVRQMEEDSLLLSGELASEEAMKYWRRLQERGFVDANYKLRSNVSRQQAMYIAMVFAEKLGLSSTWKPFELLWRKSNLAQEKWKMQQTGSYPLRAKEIEHLFED
ncbi:MAG: S24 family peptidase [Prevotella sp.]|nr:S24 family peptidase [Prevotella sp.]